ncbi:LysR family transcriptional regulator [uncultured Cocleimonas sp.]|uniref:LysR family transcriptional regulator n=1 Tax=uncultured Cocleimonas sp. TaxID=1051587 RepID=UPI0026385FD7|nr:LysR family transcriptional regulator [uncultured Cocleimonas sp.]
MAHISMRQIHIFDSVARYQSHTQAAQKLHMTQPAVSMQMKQLEKNLDIELFERHGKKLSLSEAGQQLREYSKEIIQGYENMMDFVDKIKGCHTGHLTITVATTANHFTTRILSAFSKKFPDVTISLDVTNRRRILEQLENYEPDLVIMGEPPKGHGLKSERFMPNPLVIIASPDHPLRDKKNLKLNQIQNEKFVVREKGSGTREAIERHFAAAGLVCETTLEMNSNEAIKHAVSAGFGLGIVSLHTVELELDNNHLTTLNVEGFPLERHWHLVTRNGKAISPVAEAFRIFVLEEADKFIYHDK